MGGGTVANHSSKHYAVFHSKPSNSYQGKRLCNDTTFGRYVVRWAMRVDLAKALHLRYCDTSIAYEKRLKFMFEAADYKANIGSTFGTMKAMDFGDLYRLVTQKVCSVKNLTRNTNLKYFIELRLAWLHPGMIPVGDVQQQARLRRHCAWLASNGEDHPMSRAVDFIFKGGLRDDDVGATIICLLIDSLPNSSRALRFLCLSFHVV